MASLWEILVPRASNAGVEFSLDYHREWDAKVRELSGGLTILKPAKGHWINPHGELFVEEMIPVRIHCDRGAIEKIIDYTLQHYDQEAVFAYELSTNVLLKRRERNI